MPHKHITGHLEWALLSWIPVVVLQVQYHCFEPVAKIDITIKIKTGIYSKGLAQWDS